ncbi:MAG TPA: SGNH/GDSL hydrolase family protein [Candidatus Binatia bacterium]
MGIHSFRSLILLGCVLWIAFAVEAAKFIEYSRNVLLTNGHWVNSKLLMQMYVMGSEQFMTTRNALFRDQLHLGEWHGFNEVSLKELVEPAAIEYRFRLSPGAYLYFIFHRSASGHSGIRLSRNAKFSSMFYQADRLNKFVSRTALDVTPSRLSDGWHDLVLSFGSDQVTATLDGAALFSMPVKVEGPQIIGLRGGFLPADVDSIRITGKDGRTILDDSFSNRRHYQAVLAAVAVITLLLIGLTTIPLLRRRSPNEFKLGVFRSLMGLGVAIMVLSLLFGFDYFFWSSRYLYKDYLPGGAHAYAATVQIEALRQKLFLYPKRVNAFPLDNELREAITRWNGGKPIIFSDIARYTREHPMVPEFLSDGQVRALPPKSDRTLRVAFLGTSQTYGSGAETISETFVARCNRLLAQALGDISVETYNFSISGSNSTELLSKYAESWRFSRPDLLVINLSTNDGKIDTLIENLRTLAHQTRVAGGRVVFLLEPNAAEGKYRGLREKHSAIQRLGQELRVPVWNLDGYLSSNPVYDSGMMWWDKVHLTSYGHGVVAEWLAPQMLAMIRPDS